MISLGRDCSVLALLFICVIAILQQHTTSADEDAAAILLAFRGNITNDPNNVLQSWDPTARYCTWYHVTCDSNDKVISIDLGNSELSGPLIPELGELTHLQKMELYDNNFIGPIPDEFGNLSSLTNLDLYRNRLSGSIPFTLSKLNNLMSLKLNDNNLSGLVSINTILPVYMRKGTYNISGNPLLCGPFTPKACTPSVP